MSSAKETILHVDLKKLEENFNYLKKKLKPEAKIIGVVKAFAYGHGDFEVSKKLEELGVYALWVSDFEEGVTLRRSGIKSKIIVANPGMKSYDKIVKYKLDVVVYNQTLLDLYCLNKGKINIHVKFNTGMNRYGFDGNEIQAVISKIKKSPHLHIESICSHLATSGNKSNATHTLKQIKTFLSLSKKFELLIKKTTIKHLLNSHGLLKFGRYQLDGVRLGIGLYGSANDLKLKQISSLKSVITQVRIIKKGNLIGYEGAFIANKEMKIAVVPVGYADGLNRRLSNAGGGVFVKNFEAHIVGEISMDSFIIDITNTEAAEGDVVEIFGRNLSVSKIAKKINTIPYEIYSTLNRRIKRVYSE